MVSIQFYDSYADLKSERSERRKDIESLRRNSSKDFKR